MLIDKIVRAASQALNATTVTSYRVWPGPSSPKSACPARSRSANSNGRPASPDTTTTRSGSTLFVQQSVARVG